MLMFTEHLGSCVLMHISKINQILDKIKKDGYVVIDNLFNPFEIESLKNKLLLIYNKCDIGDQIDISGSIEKNQYSIGKSMRIYPQFYHYFSEFSKFKQPWIENLVDDFFVGSSNKGLQIFSSHDTLSYQQVDSLPRNSHMHVDPYHALKFLVYLTDTNKENGALQIIPKTSWIGNKIRNENSLEDMLKSDLYTFKKSKYYDKALEEKIVYVEGKAGDCIILDTDVMHCGGVIRASGLERMTLIYHNRK